jgi:two-component system OmpR family response regulator
MLTSPTRAGHVHPAAREVDFETSDGGAVVLVVDDYRSVGELIAGMLRDSGFRVLIAGSGEDAKAQARVHESIDLLLTDIEMPQMRGDELAAWFRSARAGTRILFMGAQRTEAPAIEPSDFLQKPIRAETLIQKVRGVLQLKPAASACGA